MSNKPNKKTRKQKTSSGGGCNPCGCIVGILLVFILVLGVGVGVGGYYANQYVVDNFGVSIPEAFSLLGEVTTVDESKIVTNAPTPEDEQGLYDSVSDTLLLKDGTIDSELFGSLLSSFGLSGGGESSEGGGEGLEGGEGAGTLAVRLTEGGGGDEEMVDAIMDILKKENIDPEKLALVADIDFETEYKDKFVLNVKDTQLMAIVNKIWDDMTSSMAESEGAELINSIEPVQLVLSVDDNENPVFTLTLKVNIEELTSGMFTADSGIPEFAIDIIKGFIPKSLYLTAALTIEEEQITAGVYINSMTAQSLEKLHGVIGGVLTLMGNDTDSKEMINGLVGEFATPVIDSLDGILDLRKNVTDGYIGLDLFSLIAENTFPELSGGDLAMLYTRVMQADVEKMKEQNATKFFKQQIEDIDGTIIMSTEATEQEFMHEFSDKYLMHTNFWVDPDDTAEHKKIYLTPTAEQIGTLALEEVNLGFSDVAALFGMGESELDLSLGLELKSLLDTHGLNKPIGGFSESATEEEKADRSQWYVYRPQDEIEFYLTDKMLAALINSQITEMLEGNEMLSDLELIFVALELGEEETVSADATITESDSGEVTIQRNLVSMGVTLKTEHLFGDMDFVANLIDEEIGVIITMDVTPALKTDALSAPSLCYCDFTPEQTKELLSVLETVGISFFSAEEINTQFATPVRDAISMMESALGSIEIMNGKIHLPDAFTLIAANGFPVDPARTHNGSVIDLTGEEIHDVMRALYNIPQIETVEISGNPHHFLLDKNPDGWLGWTDADAGVTVLPGDAFTMFGGLENDEEGTLGMEAQMHALAQMLELLGVPAFDFEQIGNAIGYADDTVNDTLYMAYEYDIASYLDDGSTDSSYLPLETIYANFVVDTSADHQEYNIGGVKIKYYPTTLKVNTMTEKQQSDLLDMIAYIDEENADKFTLLEMEMGVLAYGIKNGWSSLLVV